MHSQLPGEKKSGGFSENSPCIFIRIYIQGGAVFRNMILETASKSKSSILGDGWGLFSEIYFLESASKSKSSIFFGVGGGGCFYLQKFLMLSPKIIFPKTGGGGLFSEILFLESASKSKSSIFFWGGGLFLPSEIELLLFDADSKIYISENSPPPPQN